MSSKAHIDFDNGYVHYKGDELPIVNMLDDNSQETSDATKAALVVAGTDNKGFVVVAAK